MKATPASLGLGSGARPGPAPLPPFDFHPLTRVLEGAVDALDFKLNRALPPGQEQSVEARRRAADAVLSIIALAPTLPGEAGDMKTQLMVGRVARRLAVKDEAVWARLRELRREHGVRRDRPAEAEAEPPAPPTAKAAPEERQLLELLLADP